MSDPSRDGRMQEEAERDPRHESQIREWSFTLFLAGLVGVTPPMMLVFDRPAMLFGLPVFYVYLLALWAGLILLIRRIASHGRRRGDGG